MQVGLSARCGRLHFPPSGLVFCTPERGEMAEEKNRRESFFTSRIESLSWWTQILFFFFRDPKHAHLQREASEFLVHLNLLFWKWMDEWMNLLLWTPHTINYPWKISEPTPPTLRKTPHSSFCFACWENFRFLLGWTFLMLGWTLFEGRVSPWMPLVTSQKYLT